MLSLMKVTLPSHMENPYRSPDERCKSPSSQASSRYSPACRKSAYRLFNGMCTSCHRAIVAKPPAPSVVGRHCLADGKCVRQPVLDFIAPRGIPADNVRIGRHTAFLSWSTSRRCSEEEHCLLMAERPAGHVFGQLVHAKPVGPAASLVVVDRPERVRTARTIGT